MYDCITNLRSSKYSTIQCTIRLLIRLQEMILSNLMQYKDTIDRDLMQYKDTIDRDMQLNGWSF